jgi:tRNA threonylcarbamoyl adenosine modification protein YeaZ
VSSEATSEGPILALVTCGPQLEVALGTGSGAPASIVRLTGPSRRSTLVMAAVDLLVEDAGIEPGDLALIAVTRGPGSFTGIRSGLATAQGLAAGLGRPIVALDSLLVQAARARRGSGTVWAAQPGRRGQVYAANWDVGEGPIPTSAGEVEIVDVERAADRGPWIAAESIDLGDARRVIPVRTAAEALLGLVAEGCPGEAAEPKYIEGPPVHHPPKP